MIRTVIIIDLLRLDCSKCKEKHHGSGHVLQFKGISASCVLESMQNSGSLVFEHKMRLEIRAKISLRSISFHRIHQHRAFCLRNMQIIQVLTLVYWCWKCMLFKFSKIIATLSKRSQKNFSSEIDWLTLSLAYIMKNYLLFFTSIFFIYSTRFTSKYI